MEYDPQAVRKETLSKVRYMPNDQIQQLVDESELNLSVNKKILEELLLTKRSELSAFNDSFLSVLDTLLQENKGLVERMHEGFSVWREVSSKGLIHSQLENEVQLKSKKLREEYKAKMWETRCTINRKDDYLSELETIKEDLKNELIFVQDARFFVVPELRPQFLEMHSEVEYLRNVMKEEARNLFSIKNYSESLVQSCNCLADEVNCVKALLISPVNRKPGVNKTDLDLKWRFKEKVKDLDKLLDVDSNHVKGLKGRITEMKKEFEDKLETLLGILKMNSGLVSDNERTAELYGELTGDKDEVKVRRSSVLVNEFAQDKVAFCVPIQEEVVEINANGLYG